jgi:16S rRNA (cytosine1402-N4)-methyltransferase
MRIHHQPVMLQEVVAYLALQPGATVIDASVGGGGHAAELLTRIEPRGRLIGIDRDARALEVCKDRLKPWEDRVRLIHASFGDLGVLLDQGGLEPVDGLLFDLGISSLQLDDPARGFSYRVDGPLDMRMDQGSGSRAHDLIQNVSVHELVHMIETYGEERYARRIAQAIVTARQQDPLYTTLDLAQVVRSVIPSRMAHKTLSRVFQAIRIAVNDELVELERALASLPALLRPGGRCVFIAYHSLEDRRVKTTFRLLSKADPPVLRVLTKKVVRPTQQELSHNKRARSARLRAAERV